jgi:hypothetical protein
MSRFAINLEELATERLICPKGTYPARIANAEVRQGNKDGRNWMMLNLTLAIKDEEVSKFLSQDAPKVFYSVGLNFDKETEAFNPQSPDFGALMKTLDLNTASATTAFQDGTEDAATMWEFNTLFFTNVANTLAGYDLLIEVTHKANYQDKSRMDAVVSKVAKLD